MDNEFDDFQSFKPAKIEPDEFKPEKEKKKDDPLMTVCLIWFVLGVVFFLVIGSVAYVPSGNVLDDRFLNTLHYSTR